MTRFSLVDRRETIVYKVVTKQVRRYRHVVMPEDWGAEQLLKKALLDRN